MTTACLVRRIACDNTGVMAVETALIAPLLLLMSLGAFQVSSMVARQTELQNAMSDAEAIALASDPDNDGKRLTIKQIIQTTTGLPTNKVTVTGAFRCNSNTAYVTAATSCASGDRISSYVKIEMTDTYVPVWTEYGVGSPVNLSLQRYVMFKQATNP